MKRQFAWVMFGARRTQQAFDDQGTAIRDLQQQLAELRSAVARIEARAEPGDGQSGVRTAGLDELTAKIDRIDSTVTELVRVVAGPKTD